MSKWCLCHTFFDNPFTSLYWWAVSVGRDKLEPSTAVYDTLMDARVVAGIVS